MFKGSSGYTKFKGIFRDSLELKSLDRLKKKKMASESEDEKNSKALRDWEKFVSNPLVTDEEVAQELVNVLNAYGDELRFIQEQYHYLTGKRLEGFAYPEGRVKMSDIIFRRDEDDKEK